MKLYPECGSMHDIKNTALCERRRRRDQIQSSERGLQGVWGELLKGPYHHSDGIPTQPSRKKMLKNSDPMKDLKDSSMEEAEKYIRV